jgi:hypothetical protein
VVVVVVGGLVVDVVVVELVDVEVVVEVVTPTIISTWLRQVPSEATLIIVVPSGTA